MNDKPDNREPASLNLLIVDDHPVVGVALQHIFEQDGRWRCIRAASGPEEAMRMITRDPPDAIVVDMMFPQDSGLRLLHWLHAEHPGIAVVVYSLQRGEVYGPRCLAAGARAYVNKCNPPERVLDAVHRALSGETAHLPTAGGSAGRDRASPCAKLSARELEVMNLLGQGLSNAKIAGVLSRSVKTIESHRYRISRKLGIENGPALVHLAIQHRIADESASAGSP